MKKKVVGLFFIFFSAYLFSQQKPEEQNILNSNNANFSKVLTGQAICQPANLSFGTALINDARSFICLNDNGKILWEQKLRFSNDAKIFTLQDDFLMVLTKKNSLLTLYNSSGIEIFHKELNQPIISNIVQGYDSRLFLPLENKICCISLGGIQKWEFSIKYEGSIYTLKDGTLIVQNGNSLCRLTPFGELIEEIIIEKQIRKILQCKSGIMIYFEDSSASYFTSEEQSINEKWQLKNSFCRTNSSLIYSELSDYLIVYHFNDDSLNIKYIDEVSGKIKTEVAIKTKTKNSSYKFYLNQNGLLIINDLEAEFYDNFGTISWKRTLSEFDEEKPIYTILKNNNDLIFFCGNWSINYFTIIKKTAANHADNFITHKKYKSQNQDMISNSSILFSGNFKELSKQFLQGNFENNEEYYIKVIKDFYNNYVSTLESTDFGTIALPTQFESDITVNLQLIGLSFNLHTDEFSDSIIQIIRNEKNPAVLKAVFNGLGKFGYDKNLMILSEINNRAKKLSPHEENLIPFFCDATFSICKFMGKNAFEKYGNSIIKTFFSEQFSPDAKQTARDTYLKISKFFQYN